jgi:GT2 family glycosyltransferase
MPPLSLLIVNWNGWSDLERCLTALGASGETDLDVLVIDNGSTDGSVAKLARCFPCVRVECNETNVGHTRAVNQGFSLVQGERILLLDPDTEIDRASIRLLERFLDERPDVSVVAPRTYNTDGSVQESARNFPSWLSGLFGRQSLLTRLFPHNPFSHRYLLRSQLGATEPFEVEQVSAACMLLRRKLISEVGPWDEGYGGYWVDTDWCMQLRKQKKRIYCVPQASVIHHENNRADKRKSPRRIWLFHQGAYRFYRKYYTRGWLDPRALLALCALSVRAALLSMQNYFLGDAPAAVVPQAAQTRPDLDRQFS